MAPASPRDSWASKCFGSTVLIRVGTISTTGSISGAQSMEISREQCELIRQHLVASATAEKNCAKTLARSGMVAVDLNSLDFELTALSPPDLDRQKPVQRGTERVIAPGRILAHGRREHVYSARGTSPTLTGCHGKLSTEPRSQVLGGSPPGEDPTTSSPASLQPDRKCAIRTGVNRQRFRCKTDAGVFVSK